MLRPTVLLFDLGGVLVESALFERLHAHLPVPLSINELKIKWLESNAVRSFEKGTCSPSVFASTLVKEWQLSLTPDEFIESFASWPKGFYPGVAAFLSSLRRQYKLACLSNSNAIHWERFGGFQEHFDISLSSHLLAEVKPDAACFALALLRCEAEPEAVAFFDDSYESVVAARAFGMQAFHVNGFTEVRRVFEAEGWL